jgi:hypothetical protein
MIEPVTSLDEKIERLKRNKSVLPQSFIPNMFLAHLKGLENFAGKKVLEIGGREKLNLASFFSNQNTDYTNIRLEGNSSEPNQVIVGNFMNYPLDNYDLIISSGVFEPGAIDKMAGVIFRDQLPLPNDYYLARLNTLTNPGGLNIHATSSDNCIFSNKEINRSGFGLQYRNGPFFNFYSEKLAYGDFSELVVMRKSE